MRGGIIAAIAAGTVGLLGVSGVAGAATFATAPSINTIAGGVGSGPGGTVAMAPSGVTASGASAFISNYWGQVWRLDEATGMLSPIAGVGAFAAGDSGNGTPALQAALGGGTLIADRNGNLLLADQTGNRVWVIAQRTGSFYGQNMVANRVYTLAGTGTPGFAGDGAPAARAELDQPQGVSIDGSGNLVIADRLNQRIRVVAERTGRFYGQQMTAGDIYTAVFTGPGLSAPAFVAADHFRNLVVADGGTQKTYIVAESTGTFYGIAMTAGGIYQIAPMTYTVFVDGSGNILMSAPASVQVLAASTGTFYGVSMTVGKIYTIAGGGTSTADGVPALQAKLAPGRVSPDQWGNLLISQGRREGVRVLALSSGTYYGKAMTAGDVYSVAGDGNATFSGQGTPGVSAQFYGYSDLGLAADVAGNILIGDNGNNDLRVLAGQTGTFYGQQMTKGDIYTIAGTTSYGATGSGIPAVRASLELPSTVTVDASGNVIIVDDGLLYVIAERTGSFYGLQMVSGDIYRIKSIPSGVDDNVAVDHNGNLVYTSGFEGNDLEVFAVKSGTFYGVRMTAFNNYHVAGAKNPDCTLQPTGPALAVGICDPAQLAVDSAGNVVLTEGRYARVFVLTAKAGTFYGQKMNAGSVYAIAGTGRPGSRGDGGPALQAELNTPYGLAIDAQGNLVIGDRAANRIRVLAVKTGVFYGQSMTAGDIYALAGTGTALVSGDGGAALKATMSDPGALAVTPAGGVVITDDNRVRLIG